MSAWRDRLANLTTEKIQDGPGSEPSKPPKPGFVSFVSDPNGPMTDFSSVMRDLLLRIAADEGMAPSLIELLDEADINACQGESESAFRAYVRALHREADLAIGTVPATWTAVVRCRGCGPVWLWPTCPTEVIACPWCRHRKAGTRIPTPAPSFPT